MNKLTFAVGSAYTAFLAFTIVCIDQLIHKFMPISNNNGFVYIAFIAWAVYFFSGCTLKGGIRAAIGYVVGILISIVIMLLAGSFDSAGLGFVAVPLAVFFIVFAWLYLEKVPWFDLIPAMFVAAGCFFGIMTYVPEATFCSAACVEILYGFIGLTFGWITITGKGILEKALKKS